MQNLDIKQISPWKLNPRSAINEESLAELAESIKSAGVLQPIVVRPANGDKPRMVNPEAEYIIVAGERRYRAAYIAGLETVPAIVKDLTEAEALEIAIVENLQREDISAIEEARAYKLFLTVTDCTQKGFAKKIGKTQGYIANRIRLLKLPDELQAEIISGEILVSDAREMVKIVDLPGGMDRARKIKEDYRWGWKDAIKHAITRIKDEISDQQKRMNARTELADEIVAEVERLKGEGKNARAATDDDHKANLQAQGLTAVKNWDVTEVCKTCEKKLHLVDCDRWARDDEIDVDEFCPDLACYAEQLKAREAANKAKRKEELAELKAANLPRKEFMRSLTAKLCVDYEIADIDVRYLALKVVDTSYGADAFFKKICEEMGWTKTEGVEWSARARMGINNGTMAELLKLMLIKHLIEDEKLASERYGYMIEPYLDYLKERGFEEAPKKTDIDHCREFNKCEESCEEKCHI